MNDPIHNEQMDDFYKDFLQDYKADPDDFVWDAIESKLDTPKPNGFGAVKFWSFMGAFVLFLGAGVMSNSYSEVEDKSKAMGSLLQKSPNNTLDNIQLIQTNTNEEAISDIENQKQINIVANQGDYDFINVTESNDLTAKPTFTKQNTSQTTTYKSIFDKSVMYSGMISTLIFAN